MRKRYSTTFEILHSRQYIPGATTNPAPPPRNPPPSVNNSQHLPVAIISNPSPLSENPSKSFTSPKSPNIPASSFQPHFDMAPQTTAIANNQPPSNADTEMAAWCIPFLAFYAFGVLAAMTMTWAAAKYSKRPLWPPAAFCKDNRSGPMYQLVLYLPSLLWLAVLAGGILWLLGCGVLHLWRWLVQKLSSASGNAGTSDEVSLRGQTNGVGGLPLKPVGEDSTDTTKGDILQVETGSKGIAIPDEIAPRPIPPNQEHVFHVQDLSITDKDTRQGHDKCRDQPQESTGLESRCE